jgi:hypothetical protein
MEVRRAVLEKLGDEWFEVRQSALRALSGVVGTDAEVRRVILERLGDEWSPVRQSALRALAGVVGTDAEVRRAVLEGLEDENDDVRSAAVRALESLFGELPEVTRSIVERLTDRDFAVRLAAVEVVAGATAELVDAALLDQLRPWLMVDADHFSTRKARSRLAALFGPRSPGDSSLRDWLLVMLGNPRWSARLGAALTLLNWPDGLSDDVLDRIFKSLEDRRGLEAYPAQLTAASFLINQDKYAKGAIDICLEALDYGTQTWEGPLNDMEVREQAALVLGKLEPVFYDERIYDKLVQVLEKDISLRVKDAAYGALVRLARIRDRLAEPDLAGT